MLLTIALCPLLPKKTLPTLKYFHLLSYGETTTQDVLIKQHLLKSFTTFSCDPKNKPTLTAPMSVKISVVNIPIHSKRKLLLLLLLLLLNRLDILFLPRLYVSLHPKNKTTKHRESCSIQPVRKYDTLRPMLSSLHTKFLQEFIGWKRTSSAPNHILLYPSVSTLVEICVLQKKNPTMCIEEKEERERSRSEKPTVFLFLGL